MMISSPQRVAAVDIGSNTVHMIVAELGATVTEFTILDRQVALMRLGADVARMGTISPNLADQTVTVLAGMAATAREWGVTAMLGLATEGVRAAANAQAVIDQFSVAWGAPIALISGLEEAALTYWGASADSPIDPQARVLVGDLGGGSCELVIGTGATVQWARSLPLGSGRILDAIKPADPPTEVDRAALARYARDLLAPIALPLPLPELSIAVGGTATSLLALLPDARSISTLTRTDLAEASALLGSQPSSAIAERFGLDSGRARLLAGGVIAWEAILTWSGQDRIFVSVKGVRDGAIIAWRLAGADWQTFARQSVPPEDHVL